MVKNIKNRMSLLDQIKTLNTKTFTLKCGYCQEEIKRHSLKELGEAVVHNRELNCKVCVDCNREMTIDNVLDEDGNKNV